MDSVYGAYALRMRVSPFGYLRISAYVRLPEAFRSLSRPSSALSAKASALRPSLLNLLYSPFRMSGLLFLLPEALAYASEI